MDEKLLLLLHWCNFTRLPDWVGGHVDGLSCNIQEAAVHVDFDNLVAGSELRVLGHGSVKRHVFTQDLSICRVTTGKLGIEVCYLGVNPSGHPVTNEVVNAVHHGGVIFGQHVVPSFLLHGNVQVVQMEPCLTAQLPVYLVSWCSE